MQLGKTLDEVREYFNPRLQLLGYLFTMSEPTINASTSLQILRQTYTDRVLRTVIPRNTDLRDVHFNKTVIYPSNPHAKVHMAVLRLCEHQLELVIRAVAAYKPAQDQEEDYTLLVGYLAERAEEQAIWDELLPEDIPF